MHARGDAAARSFERRARSFPAVIDGTRPCALTYHCGSPAPLLSAPREREISMYTPEGFTPSHARPDAMPGGALAFAFRDDKILVAGPEDAPVVPQLSKLEELGMGGDGHYLGDLAGVPCIAVPLPAGRAGTRQDGDTPGCARSSSAFPSRWSRSPDARSRSSNGIALIAIAAGAERRPGPGPTSARRSAPRAATSPTRA